MNHLSGNSFGLKTAIGAHQTYIFEEIKKKKFKNEVFSKCDSQLSYVAMYINLSEIKHNLTSHTWEYEYI